MKLAKVRHIRCNEYAATTYLFVPNELSQDDLRQAVLRAQKTYLADAEAWKNANPAPADPSYSYFSLEKYPPNTTISEILEQRKKEEADYKEWEATRRKAQNGFVHYLKAEITDSEFIEDTEAIESSVDWGHHHGKSINYGEFKDQDLKGAAASREEF